MLVLTNEQATTAAVRSAFQTFLKTRPGKNDTVYVMIAGHGTVNNTGAYILTYDSDTENLAGTALPMAELHAVVEQGALKSGPCDSPGPTSAGQPALLRPEDHGAQRRGSAGERAGRTAGFDGRASPGGFI